MFEHAQTQGALAALTHFGLVKQAAGTTSARVPRPPPIPKVKPSTPPAGAGTQAPTGAAAPSSAPAAGPGWGDRAKAFGLGQVDAAKALFANTRGGVGGKMNPNLVTGPVPAQSMDMARGTHRQEAVGNLKTLAPTLLAGGGLYMAHRHSQNKEEEQQRQQQQQMMMMMGAYR